MFDFSAGTSPFSFGAKFVTRQRVVSSRLIVPAAVYRVRARAAIQRVLERIANAAESLPAAPFSILHDYFDWKNDIDLEVCVPVPHSYAPDTGSIVRLVEGSAVLFACLSESSSDMPVQTGAAIRMLEDVAIAQDRIFAGDVREVHPWRGSSGIEIQLPVI